MFMTSSQELKADELSKAKTPVITGNNSCQNGKGKDTPQHYERLLQKKQAEKGKEQGDGKSCRDNR